MSYSYSESYQETWSRYDCGQCGKAGWYCHGDINDITHFEPDILRCWNCKGIIFFLGDEADFRMDHGISAEEEIDWDNYDLYVDNLSKNPPQRGDSQSVIENFLVFCRGRHIALGFYHAQVAHTPIGQDEIKDLIEEFLNG